MALGIILIFGGLNTNAYLDKEYALEDTHVAKSSPTSNFGTSSLINIYNHPTSGMRTYILFEVNRTGYYYINCILPSYSSAKYVNAYYLPSENGVFGENTTTWNNQPCNTTDHTLQGLQTVCPLVEPLGGFDINPNTTMLRGVYMQANTPKQIIMDSSYSLGSIAISSRETADGCYMQYDGCALDNDCDADAEYCAYNNTCSPVNIVLGANNIGGNCNQLNYTKTGVSGTNLSVFIYRINMQEQNPAWALINSEAWTQSTGFYTDCGLTSGTFYQYYLLAKDNNALEYGKSNKASALNAGVNGSHVIYGKVYQGDTDYVMDNATVQIDGIGFSGQGSLITNSSSLGQYSFILTPSLLNPYGVYAVYGNAYLGSQLLTSQYTCDLGACFHPAIHLSAGSSTNYDLHLYLMTNVYPVNIRFQINGSDRLGLGGATVTVISAQSPKVSYADSNGLAWVNYTLNPATITYTITKAGYQSVTKTDVITGYLFVSEYETLQSLNTSSGDFFNLTGYVKDTAGNVLAYAPLYLECISGGSYVTVWTGESAAGGAYIPSIYNRPYTSSQCRMIGLDFGVYHSPSYQSITMAKGANYFNYTGYYTTGQNMSNDTNYFQGYVYESGSSPPLALSGVLVRWAINGTEELISKSTNTYGGFYIDNIPPNAVLGIGLTKTCYSKIPLSSDFVNFTYTNITYNFNMLRNYSCNPPSTYATTQATSSGATTQPTYYTTFHTTTIYTYPTTTLTGATTTLVLSNISVYQMSNESTGILNGLFAMGTAFFGGVLMFASIAGAVGMLVAFLFVKKFIEALM
jgi:hypothetical protein